MTLGLVCDACDALSPINATVCQLCGASLGVAKKTDTAPKGAAEPFGAAAAPKVCAYCGEAIAPGHRFCGACGKPTIGGAPVPSTQPNDPTIKPAPKARRQDDVLRRHAGARSRQAHPHQGRRHGRRLLRAVGDRAHRRPPRRRDPVPRGSAALAAPRQLHLQGRQAAPCATKARPTACSCASSGRRRSPRAPRSSSVSSCSASSLPARDRARPRRRRHLLLRLAQAPLAAGADADAGRRPRRHGLPRARRLALDRPRRQRHQLPRRSVHLRPPRAPSPRSTPRARASRSPTSARRTAPSCASRTRRRCSTATTCSSASSYCAWRSPDGDLQQLRAGEPGPLQVLPRLRRRARRRHGRRGGGNADAQRRDSRAQARRRDRVGRATAATTKTLEDAEWDLRDRRDPLAHLEPIPALGIVGAPGDESHERQDRPRRALCPTCGNAVPRRVRLLRPVRHAPRRQRRARPPPACRRRRPRRSERPVGIVGRAGPAGPDPPRRHRRRRAPARRGRERRSAAASARCSRPTAISRRATPSWCSTPPALVVRDTGASTACSSSSTDEEELADGDVFRIGQELLRFDEIPPPVPLDDGTEVMGSPNPGYWGRLALIVGRDQDGSAFPLFGDAVIARPRARRHPLPRGRLRLGHARARRRCATAASSSSDLNSSNGTFVRMRGERAVTHGRRSMLMGQQLFRISYVRLGRGAATAWRPRRAASAWCRWPAASASRSCR